MSVVLLLRQDSDVIVLVRWALRFAHAKDDALVVLQERGDIPEREVRLLAWEKKAVSEADNGLVEFLYTLDDGIQVAVWQFSPAVPADVLHEHLHEVDAALLVLPWRAAMQAGELEDVLFLRATPATVFLQPAESTGESGQSLLVGVSHGPNSRAAIRLAQRMAASESGEVAALYVQPDLGEDAEQVGARSLARALRRAVGESAAQVRPRVAVGANTEASIEKVAAEGFDAVFVGAGLGILQGLRKNRLPRRLLASTRGSAVAVLRRSLPLKNRLAQTLENFLSNQIPQLERASRIELFESVQSNSRWNFDFQALVALSTTIAALGLVLNSAAVVIGAMLVAPLMTPLIGSGLALVQSNGVLLRNAARSVALGFLLAFLIGLVLGAGLNLVGWSWALTPVILARGEPTILDVFVAFVSGVAAAYAWTRPNLSSALPGVAIAAALVPPIASSGLAASQGSLAIAQGALSLFGVNIVAIVLGSTVSLWLVGVRPGKTQRPLGRWVWGVSLVLVAGLLFFATTLRRQLHPTLELPDAVWSQVERRVQGLEGGRLVSIDPAWNDTLEVHIEAATLPAPALAAELKAVIEGEVESAVRVRVVTAFVQEAR